MTIYAFREIRPVLKLDILLYINDKYTHTHYFIHLKRKCIFKKINLFILDFQLPDTFPYCVSVSIKNNLSATKSCVLSFSSKVKQEQANKK